MYSVFRLRRSPAEWLEDTGEVLATWHVFNPNGPTVNCVGLRETGAGGEQEVFTRWMHFTGGEDHCLGYVNMETEEWGATLFEVLQYAFSLSAVGSDRKFPLVTCVPYAVTCMLEEPWQRHFCALFAQAEAIQRADWGRERYYLAKYGSDLFGRAGEEYRESYERLRSDRENANSEFLEMMWLRYQNQPTFANWTPNAYTPRGLQAGDVEAWWDTVTSKEHLVSVLPRMAEAWVGASSTTPGTQAMTITSFEEVRNFLAHYQHALWSREWTTHSIAASMGFSGTSDA